MQAQIATLDRWNDEIARDPLVRPALEPIAAELSGRAAALDEAFAVARVQREIAEETQASLIARRDQLTPALNQVNGQLPGASEELRVARLALDAGEPQHPEPSSKRTTVVRRIEDGPGIPDTVDEAALEQWADELERARADYDVALGRVNDAQQRVNGLTRTRDRFKRSSSQSWPSSRVFKPPSSARAIR